MDFEFMKDLMGDSYKEGITLDEVKTFMDGKKFAAKKALNIFGHTVEDGKIAVIDK